MLLKDRFDSIKGVNGFIAPELMKYVRKSSVGVFYPLTEIVKISDKADIFSLGVNIMRMLLGDRPIASLGYHQGSCLDKKCFKQYLM